MALQLREVAGYRELLGNLTRRELNQRYRGSALGALWSFLQPLTFVAVYTLIFTYIFKTVSIQNYPIFLLCGQVTWMFFSGAIGQSAASLVANAALVQKVRFPKLVMPIAVSLANLVNLGILLVVLLPLVVVFEGVSKPVWPLVPVMVLLLYLVTLGFGMCLSIANVYFRDVEHFLTAAILPWFFLTPIFYSLTTLPEAAANHPQIVRVLYYVNFIAPFIDGFRRVLFEGTAPSLAQFGYMVAVAAVFCVGGLYLYSRFEDDLAAEL